MDLIELAVAIIQTTPHLSDFPVINFDHALRVLCHGASLSAVYHCRREDVGARNLYDNHTGVAKVAADVMKKIVDGVNNHFVLVLPR